MTVKWYEWNSLEEFNVWHDNLCNELKYPLDSINQATGIKNEKAKTLRYTDSLEVEGKVIAIVEDEHAEGLTLTELRPPTPDFF